MAGRWLEELELKQALQFSFGLGLGFMLQNIHLEFDTSHLLPRIFLGACNNEDLFSFSLNSGRMRFSVTRVFQIHKSRDRAEHYGSMACSKQIKCEAI